MTYITGRPEWASEFEEIELGSAAVAEAFGGRGDGGARGHAGRTELVEVREYRGG